VFLSIVVVIVVVVTMTVVMIPAMLMAVVGVLMSPPVAPRHPRGHTEDQQARHDLEIGLGLLRVPMGAEGEPGERNHPDDGGMRKCGGKTEQHSLSERAANRDDEGGNHRFGMARFETVQCAEGDCAGNEDPGVIRAGLEKVGETGRQNSSPFTPAERYICLGYGRSG